MRRIRNFHGIQPLFRAVSVISAVAVLATGVTFAALQSQQAVLTGNSIKTANADLKISGTGSTYSNTKAGFTFGDVIPGATASPADGNSFYLKNFGTQPMTLKVGISTVPVNASAVDLSKTYLVLSRVDTTTTQKFSIASLVAGGTTAPIALTDNLAGATAAQYKAQITMDLDAFTGQSADITGIDLIFGGTIGAQ